MSTAKTPEYVAPEGYPPFTCELCWPSPEWWQGMITHRAPDASIGEDGYPGFKANPYPPGLFYLPEHARFISQIEGARYWRASKGFMAGVAEDGSIGPHGWCFDVGESSDPHDRRTVHTCDTYIKHNLIVRCGRCRDEAIFTAMIIQRPIESRAVYDAYFAAEMQRRGWTFEHDGAGIRFGRCPKHPMQPGEPLTTRPEIKRGPMRAMMIDEHGTISALHPETAEDAQIEAFV